MSVRFALPARVSAASGLVWALIAWFIGYGAFGGRIWSGIIIGPLIGVLVGRLSWPLHDKTRWVQIAGSLFGLYIAAVCFAIGMGLYSLASGPGTVKLSAVLIEHVLAGEATQPAAHSLRDGELHRLPRRDGATRVLARAWNAA